jgi:hypothetical protein
MYAEPDELDRRQLIAMLRAAWADLQSYFVGVGPGSG